jgi:Amt family ammonium transporter
MFLLCVVLAGSPAFAQDPAAAPPATDSGDTAFVLISAALVLLMTIPGLALFYGGMVRTKNILGTLAQSFVMAALISVQWVLFGYSIAFGPGSSFAGGLQWLGLNGVDSAATPITPELFRTRRT